MTRVPTALAALLVLFSAAGGAVAGETWWSSKWTVRRAFRFTGTRSELPGDEVGVVEFRTGGRSLPDGRDVRVLARGRKLLPVKILATGPGDLLRVCFPLVKEVNSYHLYYGNKEAKATDTFVPRRGVLLASRGYKGGDVRSWKGMLGVIKRAAPSYGRDFVERIFLGHNPVGPQTNYVNKYTAWLVAPADGEYTFTTSSDDASFVFVDGRKVCEWPGWHGAVPQARPRFSGKVRLKKGLVKLEYWHVNGGLTGVAVAAWKPPGAKRTVTIPASAFAPVRRGVQLSYSLQAGGTPADFGVDSLGEAYLDADFDSRNYMIRASFTARLGRDGRERGLKYSWDFGDGQRGSGSRTEHVYVRPGIYTVKLSARVGRGKVECVNRVQIERDMRRAIARRSEPPARYAPALASYDLARASAPDLLRLAGLYEKLERMDDRLRVARALLARGGEFSDKDYFAHLIVAIRELREDRHGAKGRAEALKLLDAAEQRFRPDARKQGYRAKVIRERGDIYYFYAGDLDKAYNEYDKVVTRFRGLEDNIVRITKIRIGDIHRERGKYKEAEQRYREAEKLKLVSQRGARGEARRGALPQMAEDFLRRRRHDECEQMLNIWEWEYPMEKLRGYSALLRTDLELARKKYDEVIKLAEVMLKVNPGSNFAGELLMNQARAHQRKKRPDLALACLRRIVEKYPESPKAESARKILEKAGAKAPRAPGRKKLKRRK